MIEERKNQEMFAARKVFVILPAQFATETFLTDRVRSPFARGSSVRDDWCAWLPEEKESFFHQQVQQLESGYNMLSVSLNWAIDLRQGGRLTKAIQAVGICSELCRRLTQPLSGLLLGLCEHSKHYGTLPNTVPLEPANFQGHRDQRLARLSNLLSRVLLSHRQQFLHKVNTLAEMVEDLGKHFRMAADDLLEETTTDPEEMWQAVDADHFDLNTCLREALVLLKSFLVVLPVDQLGAFQNTVRELSGIHQPQGPSAQDVIRHRRMTQFAGK